MFCYILTLENVLSAFLCMPRLGCVRGLYQTRLLCLCAIHHSMAVWGRCPTSVFGWYIPDQAVLSMSHTSIPWLCEDDAQQVCLGEQVCMGEDNTHQVCLGDKEYSTSRQKVCTSRKVLESVEKPGMIIFELKVIPLYSNLIFDYSYRNPHMSYFCMCIWSLW